MHDQHLAVAVRSGADADQRDADLPLHALSQRRRHALEQERGSTSLGDLPGLRHQTIRRLATTLHAVAAEHVH